MKRIFAIICVLFVAFQVFGQKLNQQFTKANGIAIIINVSDIAVVYPKTGGGSVLALGPSLHMEEVQESIATIYATSGGLFCVQTEYLSGYTSSSTRQILVSLQHIHKVQTIGTNLQRITLRNPIMTTTVQGTFSAVAACLTATVGSSDNWGTQVVVSDTTLLGDGTSGNPLMVDTINWIATKTDINNAGGGIYTPGSGTTGQPATVATIDSIIQFTAANDLAEFDVSLTSSLGVFGSRLFNKPDSILLLYFDVAGTNKMSMGPSGVYVNTTNTDRVFIKGNDARYADDYSSGFADLSLINKIWADSTYIGTFNDYTAAITSDVLTWNGTRWAPAPNVAMYDFHKGLQENAAHQVALGDSILANVYNSVIHPIDYNNGGSRVVTSMGLGDVAAQVYGSGSEPMYIVGVADTAELRDFFTNGYAPSEWTYVSFSGYDISIEAYEGGSATNNDQSTYSLFNDEFVIITCDANGHALSNSSETYINRDRILNTVQAYNGKEAYSEVRDETSYRGSTIGIRTGEVVAQDTVGYLTGVVNVLTDSDWDLPGLGLGQDSSTTWLVQNSYNIQKSYNWLFVDMEDTTNTIRAYNNRWAFPNSAPSYTLNDTTIFAQVGTGSFATPQWMPFSLTTLASSINHSIYTGSGTVPPYTYALIDSTENGSNFDLYIGMNRTGASSNFYEPITALIVDNTNDPSCWWCGVELLSSDTTNDSYARIISYGGGLKLESAKQFGVQSRKGEFFISPLSTSQLMTFRVTTPSGVSNTITIDTATNMIFGSFNGLVPEIRFKEDAANGSNYTGIKAPSSIATDIMNTLPSAHPVSNGYLLSGTTTGIWSWVDPSTVGVNVYNSDGNVQDGGSIITVDGDDPFIFSLTPLGGETNRIIRIEVDTSIDDRYAYPLQVVTDVDSLYFTVFDGSMSLDYAGPTGSGTGFSITSNTTLTFTADSIIASTVPGKSVLNTLWGGWGNTLSSIVGAANDDILVWDNDNSYWKIAAGSTVSANIYNTSDVVVDNDRLVRVKPDSTFAIGYTYASGFEDAFNNSNAFSGLFLSEFYYEGIGLIIADTSAANVSGLEVFASESILSGASGGTFSKLQVSQANGVRISGSNPGIYQYYLSQSAPSTTLGDSTVMVWVGNGTSADNIGFKPYSYGSGGGGSSIYTTDGTFGSGRVATVTGASTFRINYSSTNTAFLVDDVNSATSIFSDDGTQYLSVDDTQVYIASGGSEIGYTNGTLSFPGQSIATLVDTLVWKRDTSLTNGLVDLHIFNVTSSGTAAAGFGPSLLFKGESSTQTGREMARIGTAWTTATDASREAKISFQLGNSAGALAEVFSINVDGDDQGELTLGSTSTLTIDNDAMTPGGPYNFGSNANQVITISSSSGNSGGGLRLQNSSSTAARPVVVYTGSHTSTSLANNLLSIGLPAGGSTYTASTGTGTMTGLEISGTYNLTGTASGAQQGLYINPTLTSLTAATYRCIDIEPNSSAVYGIYQDGSSTKNIFVGPTAFGSTTAPTDKVEITGNLALLSAGNKIKIATGSNASVGTATLASGTITVNTTAVTSSSIIFICRNTPGGTLGNLSVPVASITDGTSFVINSDSGSETSTVNWWIVN